MSNLYANELHETHPGQHIKWPSHTYSSKVAANSTRLMVGRGPQLPTSCLQTQLSVCSPSFDECCQKEPWEKVTAVLHSSLPVCAWHMWVDATSHTKYKQCRTRNNQLSTGISSELRQLQHSPQYYMSDSCNKFCQSAHHKHICVWETMCICFSSICPFWGFMESHASVTFIQSF